MTSNINPESISGERIEELQQIAGDHMFMHAAQTNDWRGNLKVYVKGDGVWVETADGQRHLDAMGGLWYKSAGYGRTEIADAVYAQMTAIESAPSGGATIPQIELAGKVAELYPDHGARSCLVWGGSEGV
jgi:adenosylmethionine-8-amino-7-oxononanoate aminotransferase